MDALLTPAPTAVAMSSEQAPDERPGASAETRVADLGGAAALPRAR